MKPENYLKRFLTYLSISIFVFVQLFGFFAFAPPAQAFASVVADPGALAQRQTMSTLDKVTATLSEAALSAVMGSLLHATSYFARKLAYDTANYVAYGGKGQGALAFKDGAGAYFEQVALDSAADAIGEFGKPFGLNLCQIPNIRLKAFLQVGLAGYTGVQPTPNCRWQDLRNGGLLDGNAWRQRYGSEEGLAETFSTELSINNTDFGIALGAIEETTRAQVRAENAARQERTEGNGFKPVTGLISGKILTPATIVEKETEALTAKHQGTLSAGQIAGIYGSGLKQVPAMAASVFLNTLTGTLLNRLLTEGLFPDEGGGRGNSNPNLGAFSFFDSPVGGRNQRVNSFNFLFTIKTEQLTNYPIVAEFAACPDVPGLNNCVIDTGLQRAFSQSQAGNSVTIKEAIELGYLNANWPLISPRHRDHADIKGCQVGKYCYSNIQKLRKVRALPLGFEIAALQSDPDNPWTLGQVVQGFDSCKRDPEDPTKVVSDPNFPFCNLINPNWIVAIPSTRCETNVYGPQLTSQNTPIRRKECVDISSCLAKSPTGECLSYGYCTKEENVWTINADSCQSQFNTCDTYVNNNSGLVTSYISRSLDFGQCNENNAGCRAYSLEKINEDSWRPTTVEDRNLYKAVGRNEEIYFNGKISGASSVCDADSDGCRAYIPAQRYTNGLYVKNEDGNYVQDIETSFLTLQRAPDYLGCYDTNRLEGSPEINWPTTLQEVENIVSQDPRCDAFASVCIEQEVGCAAYEPIDGGETIPGIIGAANVCDATCNGYDTFKQIGYEDIGQGFEDEAFPLYFVPNNAMATMQARGQVCNLEYVGCDEFTNLDSVAAGGEGLEYYSSLTYCEKPEADGSNIKVFYSWEGSVREGFVLRTYRVKPIDQRDLNYIVDTLGNNGNGTYVAGSPMYADDSNSALASAASSCNEVAYNLKINDPTSEDAAPENCHALYDDAGNVSYRIVEGLVFVSDQCKALRKTTPNIFEDNTIGANSCTADRGEWNAGNNTCTRCVNGGEYRNGACIYWTISEPGLSNSCPAAANQCRAYAGNTAGNMVNVFSHIFEPTGNDADALLIAREGWSGYQPGHSVRVVSEATDVGLNSLLLEQGSAVLNLSPTNTPGLTSNSFYEFSLWARGAGALDIRIEQNNNVLAQFEAVGVGNAWNRYRVGPVEIQNINDIDPVQIIITQRDGQARQVFVDTLVLTRVQDLIYLVKDSWKTIEGYDAPLVCDANPQDALPGAALGCRAYQETNSKGLVRYATGFQQLCREKAVGCTPVWDTYNTVSGILPENAHVFNLWCTGAQGANCELALNGVSYGSCIVPIGESGCYAKQNNSLDIALPADVSLNNLPGAWIVEATVYVPADTPASSPQFLANKEEHRCRENQLGCELIGLEDQEVPDDNALFNFNHQEVRIKNDPAIYNDVLCSDTLVGCGQFSHEGSVMYFKDPTLTGNSICEYRPQVNPGEPFGWMIADQAVGECSLGDGLCKEDSDCVGDANVCINKGNIACYPDYINRGGLHGLWSNGNEAYDGFVGTCPAQFNGCTELIDPANTSNVHPEGKPYYYIFNEKIESRLGECTEVGLADGCVLFDKTDNPNKIYNSKATYQMSESQDPPYGLVPPVTLAEGGNALDTNIILKVDRERQCSEWLDCKTYIPTIDESGAQTYLCSKYAACEKFSDDGRCIAWVDDIGTEEDILRATQRLTLDNYVSRGVSWYDEEFSGYSLYNKYQITNMQQLAFDFDTLSDEEQKFMAAKEQQTYLARVVDNRLFRYAAADDLDCIDRTVDSTDWQNCGLDAQGLCYNRKCFYPIGGEFSGAAIDDSSLGDLSAAVDSLTANSCKGFPEETSPFPISIVPPSGIKELFRNELGNRKIFNESRQGYSNVNVCQDGNCSCEYQKVTYRNGITDYIPFGKVPVANICSSIETNLDGYPCNRNVDCGEGGTCEPIKETQQVFGLRGFCLEADLSRRSLVEPSGYECLTWLPVQVSVGRSDIYNSEQGAGYLPGIDAENGFGQLYCSAANSYPRFNAEDQTIINNIMRRGDISFVDDIFPPGGYRNCNVSLGCVDGICGSRDASTYHYYSCGYNVGAESGLSPDFIKSWSRKHLDFSATVLRIETPLFAGGNNTPGSYYNVHTNTANHDPFTGPEDIGCGSEDSPACTIYGLAPLIDNGLIDSGTIMHPPRYWDNEDQLSCNQQYCIEQACQDNVAFNNFDHPCVIECNGNNPPAGYVYHNERQIQNCNLAYSSFNYTAGNQRVVATHPFSPEVSIRRNANDPDSYIANSKLLNRVDINEKNLVESELNRVYFLITAYPHGAEGVVPGLMNTELYIDFLALQENATDFRPRSVPVSGNIGGGGDAGRGYVFPRTDNNVRSGSAYTFKLVNDPAQNLNQIRSYSNYDRLNNVSGSLLALKDDERNQIHTRYVMVYHRAPVGQDELEGQFMTEQGIVDVFNDRQGCNVNTTNWFAIGMDFNSEGEFLGYISRFCSGQRADGNFGIQFSVVATKNTECLEIQQVYKSTEENPLSGTRNKAWTNRLWAGALKTHPRNDYKGNAQVGIPLREQNLLPFGSLPIPSDSLAPNRNLPVRRFHFRFPNTDGIPYSCGNGGNCLLNNKYNQPVLNVLSNKSSEVGKNAIFDLFAQSFSTSVKNLDQNILQVQNNAGEDRSFAFGTENGLALPQIYSLNPVDCALGLTHCSAAERNAFSVGNRNGTLTDYNGDGLPDEDVDRNGSPDAIIETSGSYLAQLRFFAFANHNRMPIRRVMIDWGEGDGGEITNEQVKGLYKNRKPVCAPSESADAIGLIGQCVDGGGNPTGMTCDATHSCATGETCLQPMEIQARVNAGTLPEEYGKQQFGDLPRACQPGYFEYLHEYVCNASDIEAHAAAVQAGREGLSFVRQVGGLADSARLNALGIENDDYVCVFQPKVQVMDNWGWCNGECARNYELIGGQVVGVGNRISGCYNSFKDDGFGTVEQCHAYSTPGNDPWTTYNNVIIVVPPDVSQ